MMVGLIDRGVQDATARDQSADAAVRAQLRGYRMPARPARVADVSTTGAMLKADTGDFRVGDELIFVLGTVQSVATIVWLHGESCGITFHRRLDAATLYRLQRLTRHRGDEA